LGFTTTQTPISGVAKGSEDVVPEPTAALAADIKEKSKPIARPVAIAVEPTIKWRRDVFVVVVVISIFYALLTA
jgi:hypothetical protein